jgi:hypothetical protein
MKTIKNLTSVSGLVPNRKGTLVVVLLSAINLLTSSLTVRCDAVTDWNAIAQTTITGNPFVQHRSVAIVQLAVFEAVNSILEEYEPYLGAISPPADASADAAAIAAAHRALVLLYPASAQALDALRAASLSAIPDGQAKDDGIAVGIFAADLLLAFRANDGSTVITPYQPGTAPGEWQPTPPAFAPALLPGWGQVETFGIENGAQFRCVPPPAINTGRYARDFNEVKIVGDLNSVFRTQDRTDVARFYAVTLAHQVYNQAARQVSETQGKTLSQNARSFALLAMAMCDGLISSMETKYFYNYWRPVTAIRAASTDGTHKTIEDLSWTPLIVTPPFPSYPSAHASAGGAAREVLEREYGKDGFSITLGNPALPAVVLHYTSWKEITDDVDDARIFGGIHFRFDQKAGARQGSAVGSYVWKNNLRPLHKID